MQKSPFLFVFFSFSLILCSCGSKSVVEEKKPIIEETKVIEPELSEYELLEKFFNNEIQPYKKAYSSTFSRLYPATEINPASIPETITFKFNRLEFKTICYALYSVEALENNSIEANYYIHLRFESKTWKIDRIYTFALHDIMRDIYKRTYANKTEADLLKAFKKERQESMLKKEIKDTLNYNKRFGDFKAYKLKASKLELLTTSDSDIINYFKSNASKFENLLASLEGETYLSNTDESKGYLLNALLLEEYNKENGADFFSIIGGFGDGLDGQEIGFVKSATKTVQPRHFYINTEPYILLLPIADDWYLYKQM